MSDTSYAGVVFIPRFTAAGAVPATDKTGKALTSAGNATVVADAGALFGYALTLDGSGDYVTTPGVAALQIGAADFTVEIRFKTSASSKCLLDYYNASVFGWQVFIDASGHAQWFNASEIKTGALTVNDGAWHHVAIVRRARVLSLWVDGVQDGATVANTTNHNANVTYLALGAQVTRRNASYDLAGLIDYVRITPGLARYSATFTPPTAADLYPAYLVAASETLQMAGATDRYAVTPALSADYLTMTGFVDGAYGAAVTSSIVLSGDSGAKLQRVGVATDALQISSAAAARAAFSGWATDAIALSGAAEALMRASVHVVDSMKIFEAQTAAGLIDDALTVWAANVATSAHSRYAHYGFNSFARFGGKHYGCKSDGIYELNGDTDGAAPIPWTVTLPETDFGSGNLKRLEYVYMGCKTTGQIVLKVVQDAGNVAFYSVTRSGVDGRASRVKLGKGARGRYWQIELASDTDPVELDSIEYVPIILSRHI